jgi:hypothetical protein
MPSEVAFNMYGWCLNANAGEGISWTNTTNSPTASNGYLIRHIPPALTFTIATVSNGNGTISCTSPVTYGSNSQCTVSPATGYRLASLSDNGNAVTGSVADNAYTILSVTSDYVLYAAFTNDTKHPSLLIRTPVNGQRITTPAVKVSGTASDAWTGGNGIASVTVNGVRASGDTAEGRATATWSITLDSAVDAITVIATDTEGLTTQKTCTVRWN